VKEDNQGKGGGETKGKIKTEGPRKSKSTKWNKHRDTTRANCDKGQKDLGGGRKGNRDSLGRYH